MSQFPVGEADTVTLCQQMAAGFTAHAADFPSVTVEVLSDLQGAIASYEGGKTDQDEARAQAKIATRNKDEIFDGLVEKMKNALKLAEVDCTANPQNLEYIGWGPRATPQPVPVVPPYAPGNLRSTAEGPGDIWLAWDILARSTVANWLAERHYVPAGSPDDGHWEVVGSSLETQMHLFNQPRGVELEYRVKAVNTAGESGPSNTLIAVL